MIVKQDPLGFKSIFNPDTGFAVRGELSDGTDPIYASSPELVDCKITNQCDNGCAYCYMGSNKDGKHCWMEDYFQLLDQMSDLCVFQIALGGGEPTMHPHFIPILRVTREVGIVPNYSTNGNLTQEIVDASREFCGAVAVSWHSPPNIAATEWLIRDGVKTNVHFILSEQKVDEAIGLMRALDNGLLPGLNAIIFLRLKPVGRASKVNVQFNAESLGRFFAETEKEHKYKIGFDACMIPMVERHAEFNPIFYDLCDGGRFSCFVDASSPEIEMKKCSFDKAPGYSLRKMTMAEAWAEMIKEVKVEKCALGLFREGGI